MRKSCRNNFLKYEWWPNTHALFEKKKTPSTIKNTIWLPDTACAYISKSKKLMLFSFSYLFGVDWLDNKHIGLRLLDGLDPSIIAWHDLVLFLNVICLTNNLGRKFHAIGLTKLYVNCCISVLWWNGMRQQWIIFNWGDNHGTRLNGMWGLPLRKLF